MHPPKSKRVKENKMKLFLTIFGGLMLAAVSVYAGGLSDTLVETAPGVMEPDETKGSLPGWVIPVAVVALLAGVAVLAGDDDDDDTT
jgi:uncharacterized membrane protein